LQRSWITNHRNVILNEQEFLNILHKRLVNRYGYQYFNRTSSVLYLNNFFSFIKDVTIRFGDYEVKLDSFHWKLFRKTIIEIFESHKFKITEYYNGFNFKFDHNKNNIELINCFEEVTINLLKRLQEHKKNITFFLEKLHQRFKNKHPKVNFHIDDNNLSLKIETFSSVLVYVNFIGIDDSEKELFNYELKVKYETSSILVQDITRILEFHRFKTRTKYNCPIFEFEQEMKPDEVMDCFEKITNNILEILQPYKENKRLFLEKLKQYIIDKYPNIQIRDQISSALSFSFVKFIDYIDIDFYFYELTIKKTIPSELVLQIIKIFEDQQFKTEIKEKRRNNIIRFDFKHKIELRELINIFEKVTDEIFKIAL